MFAIPNVPDEYDRVSLGISVGVGAEHLRPGGVVNVDVGETIGRRENRGVHEKRGVREYKNQEKRMV
jgi:hypothetical protein